MTSTLNRYDNPELLKLITSNKIALYLTLSAVVVLFPNAFYMLYKIGGDMPIPGLRMFQALLGGLYISGSIAYFTLKKDVKTAYAFAIFEMFLSFFYYWNRLMFDDAGHWHMNWYIVPACLIAMFLPWSVKNYAASISVPSAGPVEIDYNELNQAEKKEIIEKISKKDYSKSLPMDANIIQELEYDLERLTKERDEWERQARAMEERSANPAIITEQGIEINQLRKEIKSLIEDKDTELTTASKRIEELENIFQHNYAEIQKAAGLNIDLEKQLETLIKEKEWYKSLATKQTPEQPERVSPIFKHEPNEEEKFYIANGAEFGIEESTEIKSKRDKDGNIVLDIPKNLIS